MVFTYGVSVGFPAIATTSLKEGVGGITMTDDEITWFGKRLISSNSCNS